MPNLKAGQEIFITLSTPDSKVSLGERVLVDSVEVVNGRPIYKLAGVWLTDVGGVPADQFYSKELPKPRPSAKKVPRLYSIRGSRRDSVLTRLRAALKDHAMSAEQIKREFGLKNRLQAKRLVYALQRSGAKVKTGKGRKGHSGPGRRPRTYAVVR